MKNYSDTIAKIKHARASFPYFTKEVFSKSEGILKGGSWVGGAYIDDLCGWLQDSKQTIRVSARDHFKSMGLYSYIMWLLLRNDRDIEIQYFSYNAKMAGYHVGKIKTGILSNPYYRGLIDRKAQADSVIGFSWGGEHRFTVTPRGLMEFKRGIHCPYIFVDDPLQDPESKLVPTKITRINEIMKTQILDMFQEELHIVGTPQTNSDFFFDNDFTRRFSVRILPAILDWDTKKVLWKEWMSYDELMEKKIERGDKAFNQEYMCSPVYSEEAFIKPDQYDICVNRDLKNWAIDEYNREDDLDVVGGFDIGKKSHPSHLAIFKKVSKDKWIQLHSRWFDGVDYVEQIEYLERAIKAFGVYMLCYDNTRGEFESIDEQGNLPAEMEPVNFTHKKKHSLATNLDKAVQNKHVEFLVDNRQRSQMLIVNNDLMAPVTKEGHGDSFFSICMALSQYGDDNVDIWLA